MTANNRIYKEGHLSSDNLLKYHRHLLKDDEMTAIKYHLESCELCSDALGGVAEMHDAMAIYHVTHDLKKKLKIRYKSRKIFSRNEIFIILLTIFVLGLIVVCAAVYYLTIRKSL